MMLNCHLEIIVICYRQGVESMRLSLQQKFWIFNFRNALRNIQFRCVPCSKYSAAVQTPIMAGLPRERVRNNDFLFMLELIVSEPYKRNT